MRADGQVHAPTSTNKLVGDLNAGRPGADYQNCPITQLGGIPVVGGMDLLDSRVKWNDIRNDRTLKRTGRHDYMVGLDDALGGLRTEAGTARLSTKGRNFNSTVDRSGDLLRVCDEVVYDLVSGRKAILIAGKGHAGKSIVPGWPIGNQGIPPFGAPAFNNPMAFDDEMRPSALAQVLAHRQASLTTADDERFDRFHHFALSDD